MIPLATSDHPLWMSLQGWDFLWRPCPVHFPERPSFFLCVFCIPPFFGVENMFYTEPVSDIVSVVFSIAVFALSFREADRAEEKLKRAVRKQSAVVSPLS